MSEDGIECTPPRGGRVDPRYEFCAPRYHDFTAEATPAGGRDQEERSKREEREAEEWFSLLNAGFINTDLSTPRSRTCTYSSSSPSKCQMSQETDAAGAPEAQAAGGAKAVIAVTGSSGVEENVSGSEGASSSDENPTGLETEPKTAASVAPPGPAVATAPSMPTTTMCLRSRRLNNLARRTGTNPSTGTSFTVPQSPMLSTKTRASKRLLDRQKSKGAGAASTSSLTSHAMKPKRVGVRKTVAAGRKMVSRAAISSPAFRTRSRARLLRGAGPGPAGKGKGGNTAARGATLVRGLQSKKISKPGQRKKLVCNRRRTTSFEPFSLQTETRGMKKKRELERIMEGEAMEAKKLQNSFKAREVPNPFDLLHPSSSGAAVKAPTEPKPFNLRSQRLHEKAQEELKEIRTQKENAEKRMSTQFKARPSLCTAGSKKRLPFKPLKASNNSRSLGIIPVPMKLKSASRAAERRDWNLKQKQRRAELEQEKKRRSKERQRAEEKEIRSLRKSMVFKARPLPKYLR